MGDYDEKGHCAISLECKDKWEEVSVEIDAWLYETVKAYLIVVDGEKIWVPKSLVGINISDKSYFVVMPKWLAVEKNMWKLDKFDYWKGGSKNG